MSLTAAHLVAIKRALNRPPRVRTRRSPMSRTERLRSGPREPRAIQVRYVGELRTFAGRLHEAIRREVFPALPEIAIDPSQRADILESDLLRRVQFVTEDF